MRPKFNLNPRQMRHLVMITMMSFILSIPMVAQPLGLGQVLTTADQTDPIGTDEIKQTESAKRSKSSFLLEPAERMMIESDLIHRQRGESAETTTQETEDAAANREPQAAPEPLDEETLALIALEAEAAFSYEVNLKDLETVNDEPYEWEDADYSLYISASMLNLRSQPHTDSEVLGQIQMAEKVKCLAVGKGWVRVQHGDLIGFIASDYTSKSMVFRPVEETRYVDASQLNLRAEPSTSSEVVTKLNQLQKLTRTGIGHEWSKVKTADGKTGYVATKYLTSQGPVVVQSSPSASTTAASASKTTASAPRNASGSKVVDYAYSALGVRYVYAGSSMSGMDCSGFTSWVYRQVGITLPRSSYAYGNVGVGVSYSNAQPGDILAMDARRSSDGRTVISHVGIYIGNGKMIHASTSRRQIVVQDVNTILRWGAKLISVRRISG